MITESMTEGTQTMKPQPLFSPISLRYIAALRGHKPSAATAANFTFAEAACVKPEHLICLAASNPEGRFYGFVADEATRRQGEDQAAQRGIFNVIFLVGSPSQILSRLSKGSALPPMLDYLCCDERSLALESTEYTALCDLAELRLNAGGLFVTSYQAYDCDGGAFSFLARELAPEMNADQKQEFLTELNKLGASYLLRNPPLAEKLKQAIIKGTPDAFFEELDSTPVQSRTFATLAAMGSRGMGYAGDANLISNYVELAVPAAAQELVVQCRQHILYEPIKDLALDRRERSDIWIKPTYVLSSNPGELFGSFAYGITMARDLVPVSFSAKGKSIDLSSPLYLKLIDLMATLPMGVGDFLSHPQGAGEAPEKIIEALQVLVGCGIAFPMRGNRIDSNISNATQPRLVGSFNRYLDKTNVNEASVWLASPVMGCGVEISPREALVMQALNRAGLANSVSALMPELRRLAETSATQTILSPGEPTTEMAQKLVQEVVGSSLTQWYAYGLLEAA